MILKVADRARVDQARTKYSATQWQVQEAP